MAAFSPEKVCELLGTTDLPGTEQERRVLAARIGDLLEVNGGDWIRENRRMLLDQWHRIVEMKTIR